MKQFIVDRHTTPSTPSMDEVPNEKIPIYDNLADVESDLANLEAGQIVATKDTGDELSQPVDVVEEGNLHAVSSNAVADILFGDINPSGKMPITIPRCSGQIPIYYNTSCVGIDVNGYYGKKYESTFVSNYEDCEGSPLYPFGYGISYTKFEYNNLKADKNVISLEELEKGGVFTIEDSVKNVGSVDGKEVVQCYIRDCCASMARPIRELKGFEKVNIKAGKEKTVSFKLGFEELGFYNCEGKFVVEKGKFNVYVGTNCLDVQSITVSVI